MGDFSCSLTFKVRGPIPHGSTLEYEIVELTQSTLRLHGTDLRGVAPQ